MSAPAIVTPAGNPVRGNPGAKVLKPRKGLLAPKSLANVIEAPIEYSEAVEKWARQWGRHGRIVCISAIDTWQVRLTPREGDPRLRLYREGKASLQDLEETIELVERVPDPDSRTGLKTKNRSIPLEELGVQGVIDRLDKMNTLSGTGEFEDLQSAWNWAHEQSMEAKKDLKRSMRDVAREKARSLYHRIFRVPYLSVGIDLKGNDE